MMSLNGNRFPLTTSDRLSRAEQADVLCLAALQLLRDQDDPFDPRWLERWVDSIWACPYGGVSPVGEGLAIITPADILGARATRAWYRSDLSISAPSGVVDVWGSGAPVPTAATSTGTKRPAYTESDLTLGGLPSVIFDGADDQLVDSSVQFVIAGTVDFVWMILRQNDWGSGDTVWQTSGGAMLFQTGSSPALSSYSGGTGISNSSATTSQWFRTIQQFTSSASDYLQIGSTKQTGSAGSGGSVLFAPGWVIGSRWDGSNAWAGAIAEIVEANVNAIPEQVALLDAYGRARYPAVGF